MKWATKSVSYKSLSLSFLSLPHGHIELNTKYGSLMTY